MACTHRRARTRQRKSTRLAWEVNRRGLRVQQERKSTNQWRAALDWLWMARRFYYAQSVSYSVSVPPARRAGSLAVVVLHRATTRIPGGDVLKYNTGGTTRRASTLEYLKHRITRQVKFHIPVVRAKRADCHSTNGARRPFRRGERGEPLRARRREHTGWEYL